MNRHLLILVALIGSGFAAHVCYRIETGIINETTTEILGEREENCANVEYNLPGHSDSRPSGYCYIRSYKEKLTQIPRLIGGCDIPKRQGNITYCDKVEDRTMQTLEIQNTNWDKFVCISTRNRNTNEDTRLCCCRGDNCNELAGMFAYPNGGKEFELYEPADFIGDANWTIGEAAKSRVYMIRGNVQQKKPVDEWTQDFANSLGISLLTVVVITLLHL